MPMLGIASPVAADPNSQLHGPAAARAPPSSVAVEEAVKLARPIMKAPFGRLVDETS